MIKETFGERYFPVGLSFPPEVAVRNDNS